MGRSRVESRKSRLESRYWVSARPPKDWLLAVCLWAGRLGRGAGLGGCRYLWVGFLFLDLARLQNPHLIRMERVVVNDVGGDTVTSPAPTARRCLCALRGPACPACGGW